MIAANKKENHDQRESLEHAEDLFSIVQMPDLIRLFRGRRLAQRCDQRRSCDGAPPLR
jgi:hypothetical protein